MLLTTSNLQEIANSKDDESFTNAVFAMCYRDRQSAAANVGDFLAAFASTVPPPPNMPIDEAKRATAYLVGLGERLKGIPSQCQDANSAMAEASTEEQSAEQHHQQAMATLNNALTGIAVVLGTAVIAAGSVEAARASRPIIVQNPPVQNNYYISQPAPVFQYPVPGLY